MTYQDDRKARVIAVTSGKGGVGKTNISVNLAVALSRMGRRTMLVDGDFGLANANILLGVDAETTIADLLTSERSLPEVLHRGPGGIYLVPGHSGTSLLSDLDRDAKRRMADAFRPYAGALDTVILDTPTGIGAQSLRMVASSDVVMLVLSDEPTAFMDAYALVKVLALDHGCTAVTIVTNMVADPAAGEALFNHFSEVVCRFLPTELTHIGSIPHDPKVRDAVLRKRCLVEAFPDSRAGLAFLGIARALSREAIPMTAGGARFFGMEAHHGVH